jgi:hypothetical protein
MGMSFGHTAGSHCRLRRRGPTHMDFGDSEIGPPHRWAGVELTYLSLATPIRLGKHANGLPPLARNLPPMVPISIGRNTDAQRPWRLGDWVKFK